MSELNPTFSLLNNLSQRLQLTGSDRFFLDIYFILTIAVPISIFLYYVFDRYKTKTFVDLGFHSWIVRK